MPDAELREAVRNRPEGGGRDLPAFTGALRHSGLHQGEGGRPFPQLDQPQQLPLAEPAACHGGRSRAESVATGLLQQIRKCGNREQTQNLETF